MIRLVDVEYHYSIRPVLRGLNLHIRAGELVGLMGPNGMGKSTLLKVIAGVLPPLKGYVEVDGKRRRSSPEIELEIRRKMTFLPDHPWLPQARTGREYILAVANLYGIEPDRSIPHADRLLDLFELTEKGDSPIKSYSNGQKKKIALCGALIAETPILVLDEPFSGGLDPSGLLALQRVLQHLAERDDVTVVMATPVPEIVEGLADRIAVIRKGEIAAFDTPDGLRRLSGTDGPLQEVLERLINPETLNRIDRYFEKGE